jgi:hypothetical protein
LGAWHIRTTLSQKQTRSPPGSVVFFKGLQLPGVAGPEPDEDGNPVGQRQGRPHGFDTQRLPVPLEEVTPAMPQIPAAKRDRDMHQAVMAMERSAGHRSSTPLAIASATRRLTAVCVKLYTKQGNWDLVGNNIPVFFIQDAIKFPDISMP